MSLCIVILLSCFIVVNAMFPLYMEAEAKFDKSDESDISGSVIFSESKFPENEIYIDSSISGSVNAYKWNIHEFPATDCDNIGQSLYELDITKNGNESLPSAPFKIISYTGIYGRSLVGKKDSECVATPILPKGLTLTRSYSTLDDGGVFGFVELWIVKSEDGIIPPEQPVIVHVKFYHGNSTYKSSETSTGHDWHIHEKFISGRDYSSGIKCMDAGAMIGDISSVQCSTEKPEKCAQGNMAAKFGRLDLPGEYVFSDFNLKFPNGLSESFVLHERGGSGDRMGCVFLNVTEENIKTKSEFGRPKTVQSGDDGNAGAIAGTVIGVLFGICFLVVIGYFIVTKIDCKPIPKAPKAKTKEPAREAEPTAEIQIDPQAPTQGAVRGSDGHWRAQS